MRRIFIIGLLHLLTTTTVFCQTDFAQEVQRRLSSYYDNEAGPKAYLTFNQPEYAPGDTAFFKAHLLTPAENALMKGWQLLDILVTDHDNKIVLRNRTSVKNGTGASQLVIPRTAREGRYTLLVAQPDLSKAAKHPVAFRTHLIISGNKLTKAGENEAGNILRIEKGIALDLIAQKETNSLDVVLHANNSNNPPLHLVCINKSKLVEALPIAFDNTGAARHSLSMNLLPVGINRFSVVDEQGNVYADRFFYKAQNQHPATESMGTYATRKPIEFEIAMPTELSARVVNGSVSVYKKDLFNGDQEKSLADAITFADVSTQTMLSTAKEAASINAQLATATAAVDWKEIWSAEIRSVKPIYSSFFKGKIVLPIGTPKDSTLITFWFKNQDFIYHVHAPSQGQFSFPLFNEFTDDEILYTVSHKNTSIPEARVVLDSLTLPTIKNSAATYSNKQNPYAWFSSLRSEVQKSYDYFQRDENGTIIRPYVESIPTDAIFPVEKFKDFANVAEMVNEIISVAKAKKVGDRHELRVFLREFAMHASANPLIVIDGVVTDSIEYLMNMKPTEIKTLGVVNSRNKLIRYGALGRNGIITVETTRTTIQELQSKKSVFVKGIDTPIDFIPSELKQSKDRTPILRSTLFWDPHVSLTKTSPYTAELQTADDTGEYIIIFSGIDEKGNPVEIKKTFDVKYTADQH